jgi:hypothetical protein
VSQDPTGAIIVLVVGVILGVVAGLRLRSGVSYWSNPPSRFTRKEDPFSFWLSVGPVLLFAIALIVGGLVALIGIYIQTSPHSNIATSLVVSQFEIGALLQLGQHDMNAIVGRDEKPGHDD